jgi:hypothetical protein
VLKPVLRAPTRWNSLYDALKRFLELQDVLLFMEHRGFFATCASAIVVPRLDDTPSIKALVALLGRIKLIGRLLEAHDVLTISHMPQCVAWLLRQFAPLDDANGGRSLLIIVAARAALHAAVLKRLGKHLNDGANPAVLAALLSPEHSHRLHAEYGLPLGVLRHALRCLKLYLPEIVDDNMRRRAAASGACADAADDDKPQTSLVSFGADDGGGMSDAARAEQRRLDIERLEQLVNSLIMKFSTPSHLAAYAALPLPNAAPAVDVLALTTAKNARCWTRCRRTLPT